MTPLYLVELARQDAAARSARAARRRRRARRLVVDLVFVLVVSVAAGLLAVTIGQAWP